LKWVDKIIKRVYERINCAEKRLECTYNATTLQIIYPKGEIYCPSCAFFKKQLNFIINLILFAIYLPGFLSSHLKIWMLNSPKNRNKND
jgi:hypothetical protein